MDQTMLTVWIILVAASIAGSVSAVSKYSRQVSHGQHFSLNLPERTEKLDFSTANEEEHFTIWQRNNFLPNSASKGSVYSNNEGWTFSINSITFDDEGTYILRNLWSNVIATYSVKVTTNVGIIERIPGEDLTIYLQGIQQVQSTLHFYNNYSAITLVQNGVPVAKTQSNYINRLFVRNSYIQVLHVNVSDEGRYELTDHKGRLVSNKTLILVDRHSVSAPSGLAALLLLGIPGGICFCCRKRICKCCRTNKSQGNASSPNSQPVTHPVTDPSQGYMGGHPAPPGQGYYPPPDQGHAQYPSPGPGPAQYPGPSPCPAQYPSPPQWNGQQPAVPPNPGLYAPQDPVYAPDFGPGGPPAQPPQYNLPASVNYNPMMYSAPPGTEPTALKMTDLSPAAPLLTPQPEPSAARVPGDVLSSSDSAVQFQIDKGKSANNFL